MGEGSNQNGLAAAAAMLDAFASVGAVRFDVTLTTRTGEKKEWFRRGMSLADLRQASPTCSMPPRRRFYSTGQP
jgi:hypothetical protein